MLKRTQGRIWTILTQKTLRKTSEKQFFPINVDDATIKPLQFQQPVNDTRETTVVDFCETWLTEYNEKIVGFFTANIQIFQKRS